MKNFIFAMCGFLMTSLVSLSVQASSVESPKCEYVNPSVDVGLPMIQNEVVKIVPMDYLVLTAPQPVFVIAESPAIQSKLVTVPKCPFRYVYKSKHCTHYSYTAYSRLITPY